MPEVRRELTEEEGTPFDARSTALTDLVAWLRPRLASGRTSRVTVADPARHAGWWPGRRAPDGAVHRGWDAWTDLADHLGARTIVEGPFGDGWCLRFEPLGEEADIHGSRASDKYGVDGDFSRLRKFEHPGFLLPFLDALAFAVPSHARPGRALVIGCHRGDEIGILERHLPEGEAWSITGLDRSADALDVAARSHPRAHFVHADASRVPTDLQAFDLIVAVDVLQSPSLDTVAVLRTWRERLASPEAGMIVGLPCSRLQDGEIRFGARTRNYAEVDLSLLVRDLATIRRSLHQHRFRTRISGRYDMLVAARRTAGVTDRNEA